MTPSSKARRLLVADDDANVLDAYRRVLGELVGRDGSTSSDLDDLSAELFGDDPAPSDAPALLEEVIYCRQGEDAVRQVEDARASSKAFAIVFLDMRMPPGIDGLETARRIRAIDPDVNIVIVTGYSDHKPSEIAAAIGRPERLFYLLKPFDGAELQQLATALASRWTLDTGIADELAKRVAQLERMYAELKASEARAQELARLDALTGLSNRSGLSERFQAEVQAATAQGRQLSVLYLDLDRFKDVNDSLGHAIGDGVIRGFAERVSQAIGKDGFAARLGGDEFAVVCFDRPRVAELSERLLQACALPYVLDGDTVRMSVSIGIAHCDLGQPDLVEAMRQADIALYAAKSAGRGVAMEFAPSMERDILGTQRLARDLARAIATDELTLHYQPLVCAKGSPIYGLEALLRWQHPERGMIPPLVFIEVAEKTDLIRDLGDWVIRRAFADSRLWPDLVTAINLSPAQLRAPGFVERVATLAREMNIDPGMFELEVTEMVLIEDVAQAAEKLRQLKDIGFTIALDDFGSGYASLAYLSQIPFDRLKIDRSFVEDLRSKSGADGVIRSIVGLGASMGLSVTAEGVEDVQQHRFLQEVGCTHMQGFLFHRPLTVEAVLTLRGSRPEIRLSA
ncbi:EAL domain-containing protein [Aurantimonas sp. 22II-16-19i]|uniref:putative bifunctional diguanylate cyclase/phosphodiesterase n=1 Tax=Aurantimonas sp. 22II-16-19i TaxID=1317114 RepID=UPI0009F9F076|nr:EAL domain-containing protein [Aurantimonas sp. 22II-16-19i]